jgi:hypothetical protein
MSKHPDEIKAMGPRGLYNHAIKACTTSERT